MTVMPISTAPAPSTAEGGPVAEGDAFASLLHGQLATHAQPSRGDGQPTGQDGGDGELASLLQLLAGARPLLLTAPAGGAEPAADLDGVTAPTATIDQPAAGDELAALEGELATIVERLLDGALTDEAGTPLTAEQVLSDPSVLAPALAAAGLDDRALQHLVAALTRNAAATPATPDGPGPAAARAQGGGTAATTTGTSPTTTTEPTDEGTHPGRAAPAADVDEVDRELAPRQIATSDTGRSRSGGELTETRPTPTASLGDAARPVEVRRGDGSAPSAAVARVLDAIDRLEHAPPPRVVIVEHGDARLRVGLEAGTVRIALLGARTDASDQVLRETAQALQERGVDADVDGQHRRGWGHDGRDGDGQPASDGRASGDSRASVDPPTSRRAARGLQL